MELKGSVVLVTGASSGIGEAAARAAHAAGARLILLARRQARLDAIAEELDGAMALGCDVTHPSEVAACIRSALDRFGRIDALLNNAGQGLEASIDSIDLDDFGELLQLNLVAPLRMMQAVIPTMKTQGSGSIVNVSSGAIFGALPRSAAYSATKAGLSKLSEIARAELADSGITVSTLYPFITATPFYASMKFSDGGQSDSPTPKGAHTPEQVAAKVIELLVSGAARADLVPVAYGGYYQG